MVRLDRAYAIGRLVRPERSQAIISACAGATAALEILSREAGTDVHDWDTPPEHDHGVRNAWSTATRPDSTGRPRSAANRWLAVLR